MYPGVESQWANSEVRSQSVWGSDFIHKCQSFNIMIPASAFDMWGDGGSEGERKYVCRSVRAKLRRVGRRRPDFCPGLEPGVPRET